MQASTDSSLGTTAEFQGNVHFPLYEAKAKKGQKRPAAFKYGHSTAHGYIRNVSPRFPHGNRLYVSISADHVRTFQKTIH